MNPNHIAAFRALEEAQKALRAHDKSLARHYAVQAAQLAPELEEVWLMLAAVASPRASVAYLQEAIQINPKSERAHKGMAWAVKRLREQQSTQTAKIPISVSAPAAAPAPTKPIASVKPAPEPSTHRPLPYTAILLTFLGLLALFAIWQGVTPALALLSNSPLTASQGGVAWAEVQLEKPTYTLTPTVTLTPTTTFTPTPSSTFTSTPTETPTSTPTETPSQTPTITLTPSETPIPSATVYVPAPTEIPYVPPSAQVSTSERWVEINLSQQMLYAWEGDVLVGSFVVSTGTWQTPTVTGTYRVYARYKYKDMSGPGYYLPNVPNTMFFYQGYAIHGTYWHNNFGTPMSHGCVNMTIPESEWLFNWSPSNLLVNVHY